MALNCPESCDRRVSRSGLRLLNYRRLANESTASYDRVHMSYSLNSLEGLYRELYRGLL